MNFKQNAKRAFYKNQGKLYSMKKFRSSFNKLQVGLSAGSHFTIDIYQSFIIGLIPFITLKFELSFFKVALLTASSIIANSLFSPFFGMLSDKYGLKYFIVISPIITSIFLSLIGILPSYYLILLFLFIGNLGIAAYHPASAAIAGHYGGTKKGLGSSLINFGGNFGSAIGSLIIILFVEKFILNFSPLLLIPGVAVAIVLMRYVPVNRENAKIESLKFFYRLKKTSRSKILSLALIIFTIYSLYIVWITLITYMPLFFIEAKITLINVGFILFLFGMLGGAGGIATGLLFDKTKKGILIIQVMFAAASILLFFVFKTTGIVSVTLFILSGICLISIQPVCIRISQDLLPSNMSLASSLILGFGPGLAGITMIGLGKITDKIGIVSLINYELYLLAFTLLALIFYPGRVKKNGMRANT